MTTYHLAPSRLSLVPYSLPCSCVALQYGSVGDALLTIAHRSDPPIPTTSSEMRDLSLTPSSVRAARITIIHPQLRDLILPLDRGNVLYPKGTTLEQQRWVDEDEEDGVKVSRKSTSTACKDDLDEEARMGYGGDCGSRADCSPREV